jgi:hypothetical protein
MIPGLAKAFGMANRVIPLSPAFDGLVNMVNVFFPVGPRQTNDSEDIKVVQNLLHAVALSRPLAGVPAPLVNGRFDAPTGFWIFYLQATLHQGGHGVVDGIVSPSRGGASFGSNTWFIARLNAAAWRANPATYARFMNACLTGSGGGEFGLSS